MNPDTLDLPDDLLQEMRELIGGLPRLTVERCLTRAKAAYDFALEADPRRGQKGITAKKANQYLVAVQKLGVVPLDDGIKCELEARSMQMRQVVKESRGRRGRPPMRKPLLAFVECIEEFWAREWNQKDFTPYFIEDPELVPGNAASKFVVLAAQLMLRPEAGNVSACKYVMGALSKRLWSSNLDRILRRQGKSGNCFTYREVAKAAGGSIDRRGDLNRLMAAIRRLDRTAIREGRAAPGSIIVRNGTLYPGEGFAVHAAKNIA